MAKRKEEAKIFSLRLPDELRAQLEELAEKEGRTLSNLIIYLLRQGLKEEKS